MRRDRVGFSVGSRVPFVLRCGLAAVAGFLGVFGLSLGNERLRPNAGANEYGTEPCCPLPDNKLHTFSYDSVASGTRALTENRRIASLNTTSYDSALVSLGPTTDVIVRDEVVVGDMGAFWQCLTLNGAGECEQGRLVYNTRFTPYLGLACHEIGHSVGLSHAVESDTCMNGVVVLSDDFSWHDYGHLNGAEDRLLVNRVMSPGNFMSRVTAR